MRRLAGGADDVEDLGLGEIENRKPVVPGPPRFGVAVASFPGALPRARRTLFSAHAHGVHQPSAELGVGPQIVPELPLDGSAFRRARTPADRRRREAAPLLDAVEQRLAGGDGGEDQWYAVGKRVLDVLDCARPLDLGERGVNDDHLLTGDNPRQQDGHALAVLASAGIDGDESAAADHLAAIGRHGDAGAGPASRERMGALAAGASRAGKVVAYGDVCHGAPLLNGVIAGRARRPRSG